MDIVPAIRWDPQQGSLPLPEDILRTVARIYVDENMMTKHDNQVKLHEGSDCHADMYMGA